MDLSNQTQKSLIKTMISHRKKINLLIRRHKSLDTCPTSQHHNSTNITKSLRASCHIRRSKLFLPDKLSYDTLRCNFAWFSPFLTMRSNK